MKLALTPTGSYFENIEKSVVANNESIYLTGTFTFTTDFSGNVLQADQSCCGYPDMFVAKENRQAPNSIKTKLKGELNVFPNPSQGKLKCEYFEPIPRGDFFVCVFVCQALH